MEPELPPPPPAKASDGFERLAFEDSLVIALYFACLLGIAFVPPLWAALPNSITFPVEQWWRKRWPTRRKIRNIDGGRALLDHEEVPTYKATSASPDRPSTQVETMANCHTVGGVTATVGLGELPAPPTESPPSSPERPATDATDGVGDGPGELNTNPDDYFLASHEMGFLAVTASLFSSNIGSEHFIGLAGDGARDGLAVAGYEVSAGFMIALLGWIFAPIYMQLNVFTMPEFLKIRFGSERLRLLNTIVSLGLYAFTKLAASLYAAGIILEFMLGWNIYVAAVSMVAVTGLYVGIGGLRTVVYTECFQTVVLMAGGLAVAGASLVEVGGMSGLQKYVCTPQGTWNGTSGTCMDVASNDTSDSPLTAEHLHLVRPSNDKSYPWTGMFFGIWGGSIWYWCCDQEIVQRTLCAKDERNARLGCIGAAFLKMTPMFIMTVPGTVCQALYPAELKELGTDLAYPLIVTKLMPPGMVGLVTAAMLSALMSTLASVFNSSSTLFTMDVWRTLRPEASDRQLVFVGRCTVVVMCIISILWLPIIKSADSLFIYVQSVSNYLAPPITCVFIAGIFMPSVPEVAVFTSLIIGECFGLLRLMLELVRAQSCEDTDDCDFLDTPIVTMNYLHFSLINTAVCWTVIAAVTIAHSRRTGSHNLAPMAADTTKPEGGDHADPPTNHGGAAGAPSTSQIACAAQIIEQPGGLTTDLLNQRRVAEPVWEPGLGNVLRHVARTAYQEPDSVVLTLIVWVTILVLYIFYG